jgi:hypothetical protein
MAKIAIYFLFMATLVAGAVINQRMIEKARKEAPLFSLGYLFACLRTPEFYMFPAVPLFLYYLFFLLQSFDE